MSECILAIETSSDTGSVALWKGREAVADESFSCGKSRNSELFPVLENVLRKAGGDLDSIIVGVGPGSFNGTRVAIAVAQAIGLHHSCPVVGLMSFHGLPSVRAGGRLAIVGDARRRTFYYQEAGGGQLVGDVELLDQSALREKVRVFSGGVITNDDPERLGFIDQVSGEVPQARALISAWREMDEAGRSELLSATLEPAYLRPPYIGKAKARKRPGMV